jgi:hypothetical protein
MKKTILLLITLSAICLTSKTINAQTTIDEFNYITKGYKIQLESGLDMKAGYEFTKIDEVVIGERSVALSKLVNNKTRVVGYLIVYKKSNKDSEYICIPNPNSSYEVIELYKNSLYTSKMGDSSLRLQIIAFLLSKGITW